MLQILHVLSWFEKYLQNTQYLHMFPEVPIIINQEKVFPYAGIGVSS